MIDDFIVSFAQNKEDIIIKAFFPDVMNGFYVDIGANHPIDDSVTKYFYDSGWSGINIEPNIELYNLLLTQRSRDINLRMGVSDKKVKKIFREYINHGLSTFSKDMIEQHALKTSIKTKDFKEYEVQLDTLSAILKEQKVKHIHFLKIDVEGFEYEVLNGNDWSLFRPELICIESNHLIKDWRPLLGNNNFYKIFNDGINDYYLSKESLFRSRYFDYSEVFLTEKPVITIGTASRIRQLQESTEILVHQTGALKQQNIELAEQRNDLIYQLSQYRGIKSQLRMLRSSLDSRIRLKISMLDRPKKVGLMTLDIVDKDKENIKKEIIKYDKNTFTDSRLIGGTVRHTVYLTTKFIYLVCSTITRKLTKLLMGLMNKVRYAKNG